jgi:hypothetical protein
MKGREEEANVILDRLHSDKSDSDNAFSRAKIYQIQQQVSLDRTLASSWMHIIKKPSYCKRAFLAIGTCGIIQCSGVLVVNCVGERLLHSANVDQIIDQHCAKRCSTA